MKKVLTYGMLAVLVSFGVWKLISGRQSSPATSATATGVNTQLPNPQLPAKEPPKDKMLIYIDAAKDSTRLVQQRKQDPYGARPADSPDSKDRFGLRAKTQIGGLQTAVDRQQQTTDRVAREMIDRIAQMKQLLNHSPASRRQPGYGEAGNPDEAMPRHGATDPIRADPEMSRIDAMLDKLIRIQHPDLLQKDSGAIVPVHLLRAAESLDGEIKAGVEIREIESANGFIEIGDADTPVMRWQEEGLRAGVDGRQTLSAGSTVTLRLEQETSIDGRRIPTGQPVYGLASLNGERLIIHISSLRVGQAIADVSLSAYDLDGLPGIRIPGALTRDVAKESAGEALGGLGIASLDPALSAQAASAGLQMAKSLASRKARLVRVTLPAGYQVLLRNSKFPMP